MIIYQEFFHRILTEEEIEKLRKTLPDLADKIAELEARGAGPNGEIGD